jgi:hypothetical protein
MATTGASPGDLDNPVLSLKATGRHGLPERLVDTAILQFLDLATIPADEELAVVGGLRVGAADEGVKGLKTMHQPLLQQEIEGAIDGRRFRGRQLLAQHIEHLVGTHRSGLLAKDLQNLAALAGQADIPLAADALSQ